MRSNHCRELIAALLSVSRFTSLLYESTGGVLVTPPTDPKVVDSNSVAHQPK